MSGFSNSILAGTALVRPAIKSPNYVTTVSGWSINKIGTAEFADITSRGIIEILAANGSEVNMGIGGTIAEINLLCADFSNPTIEAAYFGAVLYSDGNDTGTGTSSADLIISGPGFSGANNPTVVLTSQAYDRSDTSQIVLGNNSSTPPACRIWLDGDVRNRYVVDAGNGYVTGTGSSSNSAGVLATETVVLTVPSTIYKAGRAYKITVNGSVQTTLANQTPQFRIRKTNTAGTLIDTWRVAVISTNSHGTSWTTYFYVSGADVTATIVLTLTASAGFTGTLTGAVGSPSSMQVWDHGDSSSVSAWALQLT